MTHRALAQEGPDLRREDLDIPSPRRRRHRHKGLARSRSNAVEDSRLGRRYFTGRFCPVHNWPVFRCPPRITASPGESPTFDYGSRVSTGAGLSLVKPPGGSWETFKPAAEGTSSFPSLRARPRIARPSSRSTRSRARRPGSKRPSHAAVVLPVLTYG